MEKLTGLKKRLKRDVNSRDLRWEFHKENPHGLKLEVLRTNSTEPFMAATSREDLVKYLEFLENQLVETLNNY